MLINCKPGCAGKRATTTASLDVDLNEVVCDFCGEIIEVSLIAKAGMKRRGDIVRRDNRKSFQYDCLTCEKKVQTEVIGTELVGFGCNKDCKFNVSKFTIYAIKETQSKETDSKQSNSQKTDEKARRGGGYE